MATTITVMTKITATLKSVNKAGLAAIMITASILMGFKEPKGKLVAQKWGNQSGTWVNITGDQQSGGGVIRDYRCEANPNTYCTGLFEEGVNPNSAGTGTISSAVFGTYSSENP